MKKVKCLLLRSAYVSMIYEKDHLESSIAHVQKPQERIREFSLSLFTTAISSHSSVEANKMRLS